MRGNSIGRRLVRLEAASPLQRRVFVWRELGQTSEQSIAIRFPKGVPADAQVTLLGWQGVAGEGAPLILADLQPANGGEYGRKRPEGWE